VIRDPLVHFLLLGAAAFFAVRFAQKEERGPAREEIVVTAEQVQQLSRRFEKTWNRKPTAAEQDGLIAAHLREQVFSREALAAGLGEGDELVRRHMRRKFETFIEDISSVAPPAEAELSAYYDLHADSYRASARLSFRHIYFSPSRRRTPQADARALLTKLRRDDDGTEAGDLLRMVEPAFQSASQDEIARSFGEGFARDLLAVPAGDWAGPIQSGLGVHLVRVDERLAGGRPPLADIRVRVEDDWRRERRDSMFDDLFRKLREKYDISVERK
jgi:peptidyl-prolyl cis-trans isomerase C